MVRAKYSFKHLFVDYDDDDDDDNNCFWLSILCWSRNGSLSDDLDADNGTNQGFISVVIGFFNDDDDDFDNGLMSNDE